MISAETKRRIQAHVDELPEGVRSGPATEEELCEFESRYGQIPEDYRWFLLNCGGGVVGSEWLDDIATLARTHDKFSSEIGPPRGWLIRGVFVIGWDGSGNPFGIEISTGRVVVEDHNFGGIHELAASFEQFLLRLIKGQ